MNKAKRRFKIPLLLLCALQLFFRKGDALSQCSAPAAEYGTVTLENAGIKPAEYTFKEHLAPPDSGTQLSAIFYCTTNNKQFLAGVKFTYGTDFQQEFGDLTFVQQTEFGVECGTIEVDEWITTIQYFSNDDSGLLGFKMIGDGAAEYEVKALGTGTFDASPVGVLQGPLIGFTMVFGESIGRKNTPQAMQAVVNECACDLSYYIGDQGPRDMQTDSVSGTPDLQIVPNQDNFITQVYGQDCGKTLLSIHPEYPFLSMETDPVTNIHSIRLESLQNQIGLYNIVATLTNDDPFSMISPIEYPFDVYIHPCTLQKVTITPPDSASFEIGSEATELPYSFIQVPNCQYPAEVYFTTNLPAYMEHDVDFEKIVFPKELDVSYAGFYNAQMGVRVYIPLDYTYDDIVIQTSKEAFSVDIIDPCPRSAIMDFDIDDDEVRVFIGSTERLVQTPEDTISLEYGNDGTTFCGKRIYKFSVPTLPFSNVVSFDETTNTLKFESNKIEEVGTHEVQATVLLDKYKTVRKTITFTLEILKCQIQTLMPVPYPDSEYNVFMAAKTYELSEFNQYPPCGYDVDYSFQVMQPSQGPLPGFIEAFEDTKLTAQTNDISIVDIYVIQLTGSLEDIPDDPNSNLIVRSTMFTLFVNNGCIDDVIEPKTYGVTYEQLFVLGSDTTNKLTLEYTQSVFGCPLEFEYSMVDLNSGQERPLTPEESSVVSFQENLPELKTMVSTSSSDYGLDLEKWALKVILKSIHSEVREEDFQVPDDASINVIPGTQLSETTSGLQGSFLVQMIFKDKCWLSDLKSGQFTFSQRSYDLFEYQQLQYSPMSDKTNNLDCGGFTYTLEYISGPVQDSGFAQNADLSVYQDASGVFTGTIDQLRWVGTHQMRLKGTLGSVNSIQMQDRGVDGLFESIYSQPITIELTNPCVDTRVNFIKIDKMQVLLGDTSVTAVYGSPTDAASLTYGNGYDKCGPLSYTLFNEDGTKQVRPSWLIFEYEMRTNDQDDIFINLLAEPTGVTTEITYQLEIGLRNYRDAQPALVPIRVQRRGCWLERVDPIVNIEDVFMQYGDKALELPFGFSQIPCQYDPVYDLSVVDLSEAGAIVFQPDFIYNPIDTNSLVVNATDPEHIGKYQVTLQVTLNDVRRSQSEIKFQLYITETKDEIKNYTKPVLSDPEVEIFIHTQRVRIGDNQVMMTKPQIKTRNTFGFRSERDLDLGVYASLVGSFIEYDPMSNELTTTAQGASLVDVGQYSLTFYTSYYNATNEFRQEFVFKFIIQSDGSEFDSQNNQNKDDGNSDTTDEEVIDDFQWTGRIIERLVIGDFNPDAPIPSLTQVSQTGLVTIEWDQLMEIPDELDTIATSKIALREYRTHTDFGVGIGLRKNEYENKRQLLAIKLISALELRIVPRDGDFDETEEIKFSWDVQNFNGRTLTLQLYIDDAESVSESGQLDALYITFHDTQLFKAQQSKIEVRFGTQLSWDLSRLISFEDKSTVDNLGFFHGITIASLVLSAPMMALGDMLPVWMFAHSLQLVSHTPLLNSQMPGNAQYFLSDYLTMTRLRSPVYDQPAPSLTDQEQQQPMGRMLQILGFQEGSRGEEQDLAEYEGTYNQRFQSNGYAQLAGVNLVVVIYIALAILAIWIILELKDCVVFYTCKKERNQKKWWAKRHGHYAANALLRFLYLMFLEIIICVVLNASFPDLSDSQEPASSSHWYLSMATILAIGVAFVALFCLCQNRGPYIKGFYKPGTWLQSYWELRPVKKQYSSFAMNGKGSDDIWEEYLTAKAQYDNDASSYNEEISMLPPYKDSASKSSSKKKIRPISLANDLEVALPPPTSRNLLGDEEQSPRQHEPSPQTLGNQMLNIIEDNHQLRQQKLTTKKSKNDGRFMLPDGGTEINLDSLVESDQTVPQISRGEDDFVLNQSQSKKGKRKPPLIPKASSENFYEGGEILIESASSSSLNIKHQKAYAQFEDRGTNMSITEDLDYQQKLDLYLRRLARKRLNLADEKIPSSQCRYSTLWLGLKTNHERNVALAHPTTFLMRRVIFALLVTAMSPFMLTSVLTFMAMTLFVLAFALYEHQWEHWIINQQHIVNEIFIYTMSVVLFCFGGFLGAFNMTLGWVFITIVCLFVAYNIIVMLRFAFRTLYVITKTLYVRHIRHRLGLSGKGKVGHVKEDLDSPLESQENAAENGDEKDLCITEEKQKRRISLREIDCQTEDYGGLLSRIWTWLQERMGIEKQQASGSFFGGNSFNELSFGKRKESDDEENQSGGNFGGEQVALKTLDPALVPRLNNARQDSPIRSDIFNKSGQDTLEQNTLEQNTKDQLLNQGNIPLRQIKNDSIDDNLGALVEKFKDQRSSTKKKKVTKLTNPDLSPQHLDPKRSINLLEQSGLSDAIQANLQSNTKLKLDEALGNTQQSKNESQHMVRSSKMFDENHNNMLTSGDQIPSSVANGKKSDRKGDNDKDSQEDVVREIKIEASGQKNSPHDGDNDCNDSELLTSRDFDRADSRSIEEVIDDEDEDDDNDEDPFNQRRKSKARDALKKLVQDKASRTLHKDNSAMSSPKDPFKGAKWMNTSVSGSANQSLNGSLVKKFNKRDKSKSKKKGKGKGGKGDKNKAMDITKLIKAGMAKAGSKSMMLNGNSMWDSRSNMSQSLEPKRRRTHFMDGTKASEDRYQANLAAIKEKGPPPMRYTNQGQADRPKDGATPVDEEKREIDEELELRHQRSMSESFVIRDLRIQATKLNAADQKAAKKEAKRLKALHAKDSKKQKKEDAKARKNRFKQEQNFSVMQSQSGGETAGNNTSKKAKSGKRKTSNVNTPQSRTSISQIGSRQFKLRNSSALKTIETTNHSKRNSTDGFKKSSGGIEGLASRRLSSKQGTAVRKLSPSIGIHQLAPFTTEEKENKASGAANKLDTEGQDKPGDAQSQFEQLQAAIDQALLPQEVQTTENSPGIGPNGNPRLDQTSSILLDLNKREDGSAVQRTGKHNANGPPGSSILSDWDDLSLVNASQIGTGPNLSMKKARTGRHKSQAAPNNDEYHYLKKRYGLIDGQTGKNASSKVSSRGISIKGSKRGSKKSMKETPGFNNALASGKMSALASGRASKQKVSRAPSVSSKSRGDISPLGGAPLSSIGKVFESIPEAVSQRHPDFRGNKGKSSSRLSVNKRSLSSIGGADMFVPISLDGQMIQIVPNGANHIIHRQSTQKDFSVYANAFGNKFVDLNQNKDEKKQKLDRQSKSFVVNSDINHVDEFNQNTYMPMASRNLDDINETPRQTGHNAGRQALEKFLNDVPIAVPTADGSPNSHLNFRLGGNGTMANGGTQVLQSRLNNIKQSKLFQTVMDVRGDDKNRSTSMMQQNDSSFTKAAVHHTPYQSQHAAKNSSPYCKDGQKRGSSTQLRLQQNNSHIIPDETSEGNRKDLMQGLFFAAGTSQMPSHQNISRMSRGGSSSVRSASLNSGNGSQSNRIRMGLLSRLDAKQQAGKSIVSTGCKGKRICTVSDHSSLQ